MGFDIYGMNPVIKKGSVKPERPFEYPGYPEEYDSDTWSCSKEEYQELVKEWRYKRDNDLEYQALLSKYYEDVRAYEDENPGIYFRANVWWWRPIALFLEENMLFLSDEDIAGLAYNDSHIITKDKAERIGQHIKDLNEIGAVDAWVRDKKIAIVMIPKEDCTICEGTGVRTDEPMFGHLEPYTKNDIEGLKCNGCNGEGKRDPWESNYPYDTEIILEFGKFAEESGGFQIC